MKPSVDVTKAREVLARALDRVGAAGPRLSEAVLDKAVAESLWLDGTERDALARRGIVLEGSADCMFIVPAVDTRLGPINILNRGSQNVIFLARSMQSLNCTINVRLFGSRSAAIFADLARSPVNLPAIHMRSDEQVFYWGLGATSVGTRVEIEGLGCGILVGDDCMLSSGTWLRNHDMHTIFDTNDLTWLNPDKADVVIEQHVWLGFEVVIAAPVRVGFGTILGARAFLTRDIPEQSLAVGLPAKIVRRDVSWCRSDHGVQPATVKRLERLRALCAASNIETWHE